MADQEEISNIRTSKDVDIYRDTPLRYLGKENLEMKKALYNSGKLTFRRSHGLNSIFIRTQQCLLSISSTNPVVCFLDTTTLAFCF